MTALPRRPLGRTGLSVTPVCIGGSPLGSVPDVFGYEVSADRGVATVRAVFDSPVNFLDTSAIYSHGESERRIGRAIADHGGLPDDFVLASKVDRDPDTGDFSGAQVRRSLQGSLERLGLDRLDLAYLHDPEVVSFEQGTAAGGPLEALVGLQREGLIGSLGVAGGPVDLMDRYLGTGAFDVLLTHNRWTLADRSADRLIDRAVADGIAVVNGAPFGGGILARGPASTRSYGYREVSDAVHARITAIADACARAGVPLAAAALQFSTRDPRIAATVVGVSRPERVRETLDLAAHPIPEALWTELAELTPPEEDWLW